MKMKAYQLLLMAAAAVLVAAIIFGFATRSATLTERVTPHGIVYVGGGPVWSVFERGVIYGDGALTVVRGQAETISGEAGHNYSFRLPSPLENSLMWSSACANSQGEPMDEIRGRAECGRSVRWVDISNPTPFMLAVLLCGIGAVMRARQPSVKPDPVS